MEEKTKVYINKFKELLENKQLNLNKFDEVIKEYKNECLHYMEQNNLGYFEKIKDLKIVFYALDSAGYEYSKKMFNNEELGKFKADAKTRLIMMFIKGLNEIIYLLNGGFASCALSRIRYLYEVGVILEVINLCDDNVAKKFILSSERSKRDLARISKSVLIEQEITRRLKNNGVNYKYGYEWAKEFIGNTKYTFHNLAKKTSFNSLYWVYIFSCWYVHGDIYGSMTSIDLDKKREEFNTWITKPSINGIEKVIDLTTLIINQVHKIYFDNKFEPESIFSQFIIRDYLIKYTENNNQIIK